MDKTVSVSQVNAYLKAIISNDENLKKLYITGEISNFTNHKQTGHFYFTLKDENSSIKAVMFKFNASKIKIQPENGMKVIIEGSINTFERDGIYQIYCNDIVLDGIGELYKAFEKLKVKLQQEGLFDDIHKKSIPAYPKKIAVITSKTGAAIQDIKNILARRYPLAELIIFNSLVQGISAPNALIKALKSCYKFDDIDVIIIGRGGGSIEDLWAFNDKNLAREIFNCPIPIISAVGHEIDFTISDFVADLRAPTPSAAAELATPDVAEIKKTLDKYKKIMYNYTLSNIKTHNNKISSLQNLLISRFPNSKIKNSKQQLVALNTSMNNLIKNILSKKSLDFINLVRSLNNLSPLNILSRGYSITYKHQQQTLKSVSQIKANEKIKTKLSDGIIISEVIEVYAEE
jgi:exodeoxyribonuclease VII large subunit